MAKTRGAAEKKSANKAAAKKAPNKAARSKATPDEGTRTKVSDDRAPRETKPTKASSPAGRAGKAAGSKAKPSPAAAKAKPSPAVSKPKPSPAATKPKPAAAKAKPSPAATKPKPAAAKAKPSPAAAATKAKPSPAAAKAKPAPAATKAKPSPAATATKKSVAKAAARKTAAQAPDGETAGAGAKTGTPRAGTAPAESAVPREEPSEAAFDAGETLSEDRPRSVTEPVSAHPEAQLRQHQVDALYEKLVAERERVLAGHDRHLSEALADSTVMPDETDMAQRSTEQAYLIRFADKERKLLTEIEHALDKMRSGEYGVCEGTDEPIGYKRLELRPWTRYSVGYKEQMERERSQHRR